MIIDEVLKGVRRDVREEIDEHTLNVLRQLWEKKLSSCLYKSRDKNTNSVMHTVHTVPSHIRMPLNHPYPRAVPPQSYYNVSYNNTQNIVMRPLSSSATYAANMASSTVPGLRLTCVPSSVQKPSSSSAQTPANNPPIEKFRPPDSVRPAPPKVSPPVVASPQKRTHSAGTSQPPKLQEAKGSDKTIKKPSINQYVQLDGGNNSGIDSLTDTEDEENYSEDDQDEIDQKESRRYKVDHDFAEVDSEGNILLFDEQNPEQSENQPVSREDPLNDDDDISDEDDAANNTDNIIVCRFEKIVRRKANWKVELREGIASIDGIDVVFNKAVGDCKF